MHPLRQIIDPNDLGHPLCAHLREGTWAMDYVLHRIEKYAASPRHSRLAILIESLQANRRSSPPREARSLDSRAL